MTYNVLNPPRILKFEDAVLFRDLDYRVHDSFLAHYLGEGDFNNDLIFEELGLKQESILDKAYGYRCGIGDWKQSGHLDFRALTRAAWVLLTYDLDSKELKDPSILIDPTAVVAELRNLEAAPEDWRNLSEWLPKLVNLLTGFNLDLSKEELLEILNG